MIHTVPRVAFLRLRPTGRALRRTVPLGVAAVATYAVVYAPAYALVAGLFSITVAAAAVLWGSAAPILWLPWFFIPEVRRIVEASSGFTDVNVLSLLPFAFTFVAAAVALRGFRRGPRDAHVIAALVAAALLAGVPFGIQSPQALAFGALAYGALVAAFVIGVGSGARGEHQLVTVLTVAVPVICAFSIAQWAFGLLPWDQSWVDTVSVSGLSSVYVSGDVLRVFGTLNSPGTLAALLAACVPLLIGSPNRLAKVAVGLALFVILITLVRAGWVAVGLELAVYAALNQRRAWAVPFAFLAIAVVLGASISADPTGMIAGRVATFSDLGSDESVIARLGLIPNLVALVVANPLGAGLGSTGVGAVRLGSESSLGLIDSGYGALLIQLGVVGFVLFSYAAWSAGSRAMRLALCDRTAEARGRVAALVGVSVLMLAGDAMYGVTGVLFWFLAGTAFTTWSTRRPAEVGPTVASVGPPRGRTKPSTRLVLP